MRVHLVLYDAVVIVVSSVPTTNVPTQLNSTRSRLAAASLFQAPVRHRGQRPSDAPIACMLASDGRPWGQRTVGRPILPTGA